MIVDKLENLVLYAGLSKRMAKAFQFISSNNLAALPLGKYEIDGDDVYAIVSEYESKLPDACKLEAHRRYIDIQYMISGIEQMGYLPFKNQTPTVEYNEEKDIMFFNEETSFVTVGEGMFAIFFPGDLHKPGVRHNGSSKVKKMVIKVRI